MRNVFMINPWADVQGVMGRFCTDSMAGCVTTLLEGLRRASLMHINKLGKWSEIDLYPTLEQQWQREMAPHFKSEMGPASSVGRFNGSGCTAAARAPAVMNLTRRTHLTQARPVIPASLRLANAMVHWPAHAMVQPARPERLRTELSHREFLLICSILYEGPGSQMHPHPSTSASIPHVQGQAIRNSVILLAT
jgi:hypothetical protein